jgi:hypothetical protein
MGKHYFPGIKNYLGFLWWAALSSSLLWPLYCHKKTQLPCMVKVEELYLFREDAVKKQSRIMLERYVSIFAFLVEMMMAVMYLFYA